MSIRIDELPVAGVLAADFELPSMSNGVTEKISIQQLSDFIVAASSDAITLNGETGSFYRNAGNINTGMLDAARLPNTVPVVTPAGDSLIGFNASGNPITFSFAEAATALGATQKFLGEQFTQTTDSFSTASTSSQPLSDLVSYTPVSINSKFKARISGTAQVQTTVTSQNDARGSVVISVWDGTTHADTAVPHTLGMQNVEPVSGNNMIWYGSFSVVAELGQSDLDSGGDLNIRLRGSASFSGVEIIVARRVIEIEEILL